MECDPDLQYIKLPDIHQSQYANMFDEAIKLRMIPYDRRVWDRYYFSKCNSHEEIEELLGIHCKLRNELHKDAKTISLWCQSRKFGDEVIKRIPGADDIALVRTHRQGSWMTRVRRETPSDYSFVQAQWFEQAKNCHSCPNCDGALRDTLLKTKRLPYLAFGMIVWRMKPHLEAFGYLNIRQYLGYDYVEDEDDLFNAYMASFSANIGVASISFEAYLNRKESTRDLIRNLPSTYHDISAEENLQCKDLTTFLKNDDRIWCLKEALESGLNWKDVQNNALFKDVTQRYGYDQLHLLPDGDVDEVARKLEEAYKRVFDESPVELHRLCEKGLLRAYVPQVWSAI